MQNTVNTLGSSGLNGILRGDKRGSSAPAKKKRVRFSHALAECREIPNRKMLASGRANVDKMSISELQGMFSKAGSLWSEYEAEAPEGFDVYKSIPGKELEHKVYLSRQLSVYARTIGWCYWPHGMQNLAEKLDVVMSHLLVLQLFYMRRECGRDDETECISVMSKILDARSYKESAHRNYSLVRAKVVEVLLLGLLEHRVVELGEGKVIINDAGNYGLCAMHKILGSCEIGEDFVRQLGKFLGIPFNTSSGLRSVMCELIHTQLPFSKNHRKFEQCLSELSKLEVVNEGLIEEREALKRLKEYFEFLEKQKIHEFSEGMSRSARVGVLNPLIRFTKWSDTIQKAILHGFFKLYEKYESGDYSQLIIHLAVARPEMFGIVWSKEISRYLRENVMDSHLIDHLDLKLGHKVRIVRRGEGSVRDPLRVSRPLALNEKVISIGPTSQDMRRALVFLILSLILFCVA